MWACQPNKHTVSNSVFKVTRIIFIVRWLRYTEHTNLLFQFRGSLPSRYMHEWYDVKIVLELVFSCITHNEHRWHLYFTPLPHAYLHWCHLLFFKVTFQNCELWIIHTTHHVKSVISSQFSMFLQLLYTILPSSSTFCTLFVHTLTNVSTGFHMAKAG